MLNRVHTVRVSPGDMDVMTRQNTRTRVCSERISWQKNVSVIFRGRGHQFFLAGSPTATNSEPLEDNLPSKVNEEYDKDSVQPSAQDPAAPQSQMSRQVRKSP
jgi:hypothetical protein